MNNWFDIILIAGITQGLFLTFVLFKKRKNTLLKSSNAYLSLLILVFTYSLVIKLFYNSGGLFIKYPHFTMFSDFPMFLFGPLFFLYFRSRFRLDSSQTKNYWHFIPLVVFLVSCLILLKYSARQLILLDMNNRLDSFYLVEMVGGIAITFFYLVYIKYKWLDKVSIFKKSKWMVNLIHLMFLGVTFWIVALIGSFLSNSLLVSNVLYQVPFTFLTLIFYVMAYHCTVNTSATFIEAKQAGSFDKRNAERLLSGLENLLFEEKAFRNPSLTLDDLAKSLDTNSGYLSRVINEKYQKNLSDLINEHRVNDFIAQVKSKQKSNYTFLAIAQESGFNSKVTFNRAFKKITNTTPRQYFGDLNGLE